MSTATVRITFADGRTEDRQLSIGSHQVGRETGAIVLGDPNASGAHARIDVQAGRVAITDLGSTNGTLDPAGNRIAGEFVMQPNQPIRLGGSTIALLSVPPTVGGTQVMPQQPSGGAFPPGAYGQPGPQVPPAANPGAYAAPQAPIAGGPPPGGQLVASNVTEERTFAMLCHLAALSGYVIPFGNLVGPLVIWLLKKEQYALVDDQGKESLNFQITVSIAAVIGFILSFVLIGIPLLILVGIGALVLTILAGVKANNGVAYRYPFTIRLIK